MRRLVRTELGLILTLGASLIVTDVGIALYVSGQHRLVGAVVVLLGLALALAIPTTHDRLHRERGEASHALWGKDDRRKPEWWR